MDGRNLWTLFLFVLLLSSLGVNAKEERICKSPAEKSLESLSPAPTQILRGPLAGIEDGSNVELFEGVFPPPGWSLVNPNPGSITFEQFIGANGPGFGGDKSARMDFYSYSNTGQRDTLFSKTFTDLLPTDVLKFDWAYRQYTTAYVDCLKVLLSTDGGQTWPITLFQKGGVTLATLPPSTTPFVPAAPIDWMTFDSSLAAYSQATLAFVTYNGYGNNLYIDNVLVGTRFNSDVMPVSIDNILPDTSYASGAGSYTVAPEVSIVNLGLNDIIAPFDVILEVAPGGYQSTQSVLLLASGAVATVTFANLTITPGAPINLLVTTTLSGDENPANDSLSQYSAIFPGTPRRVLFEEWTSSTCGPCAANNPTIDAFVADHRDQVVAIKYHVGWPSPGNDPMYLHNPTQSYDRRFYYGVSAVPTLIMDGVENPVYPYTTPGSLQNSYTERMNMGAPIEISAFNHRITGDSIRAEITVNILAPLMSGDYYLRAHAVEKEIHYPSPPGTNGEKDFYDVFRRAYPNSQGTLLPTTIGIHSFEFTYAIDPVWVDSMIFTAAFIQNDATKEVMNCVRSNTAGPVALDPLAAVPAQLELRQNYPNPFNPRTAIAFSLPKAGKARLAIYNILGEEVARLVDEALPPGNHLYSWDGQDNGGMPVASGVYIYQLKTGNRILHKKMILLR